MSYNNGRVYTETVGGQPVGVGIYDVQRALGVGSSDEATLCTSPKVNLWARYRPIPCAQLANNKQVPLTDAQRLSERYGIDPPIDMFTADDVQAYENYANALSSEGLYYIKSRPWGDTHWKRITDFVKVGNNRERVNNKGYDHNARPDEVEVTISSGSPQGTFKLVPLIPEEQRTIVIPPNSTNARYQLPNDHLWMDVYYQKIYGTTAQVVSIRQNDEWLSPIDFMGTSDYERSYASVRRRIIIFKWEQYNGTYMWKFYNYATDKVGGSSINRSFDTSPMAFLDLTDSEQALNTPTNLGQRRLGVLEGRCLFIDCWIEDISSTNLIPIVGFAYEVDIRRDNIEISVDVTNVMIFTKVEESDYSTADGYVVRISYNPERLNLQAGLSDAGATVVPKLQEYYDALSVAIGSTTINLLDTSLDYSTDTHGEGDWFNINAVVTSVQQSSLIGGYATITATRKDTGISQTKTIPITA